MESTEYPGIIGALFREKLMNHATHSHGLDKPSYNFVKVLCYSSIRMGLSLR